jgi:hypothetical protein
MVPATIKRFGTLNPMDEFQAWNKILLEWKQVNRMKRLNQQLYDQLGGSIMYILDYSKKNNIPLPNRDSLFRMIDNIHEITTTIKEFHNEINTSSD